MTEPMTEPPAGGYVPPPPYARPPDDRGPVPYPYAYPPYAYPPPYYPPVRPQPRLSFGVVGTCLAALGTLLVFVALIGLPWLSVDEGLTTGDIRNRLDEMGEVANQLSVSYFSWFGWVLLLLSAGCAVTSSLPRAGLSLAFRIAGPIVAAFAALFTVGAMALTDELYADNGYYYEHLDTGFWVALLGFACIGAGCIVGPRRTYDVDSGSGAAAPGTFQP